MNRSLFNFTDYRDYLKVALPTDGKDRGGRARLAEQLGIHKGFVSAVIHGKSDFSLEQAYRVSLFLGHTEEEREFFLLLVQLARAGSKDVERHFRKKIDEVQAKRREIRERIQVNDRISEADQMMYYSSWHYTAVHMCLLIPKLRTPGTIASYLGLSISLVSQILEFFVRIGLSEQKGSNFFSGSTRFHIPSDSPFVSKHHANWRLQAIQSLDRSKREDLHYSSVMSISAEAAERIREILLRSVQEMEPAIKEANDERVYAVMMDLFEVGPSTN